MIKIYGSPRTSAGRCYWCLEEVGASYEAMPVNMREKQHKSEEFLKINPNGKVPALTDGDFKIWESMAINSYLADTYKPELLGSDAKSRGLVSQWSFWALAELQAPIIDIFIQMVFVPEESRDTKLVEKSFAKLPALLKTLEGCLSNSEYVVGNEFTLADINVASVISLTEHIKQDISEYPKMKAWLAKLSERSAHKKFIELCA